MGEPETHLLVDSLPSIPWQGSGHSSKVRYLGGYTYHPAVGLHPTRSHGLQGLSLTNHPHHCRLATTISTFITRHILKNKHSDGKKKKKNLRGKKKKKKKKKKK